MGLSVLIDLRTWGVARRGGPSRPDYVDAVMGAISRLASLTSRGGVDTARRRSTEFVDRIYAPIPNRIYPTRSVRAEGRVRFALVTVNFSTTRYLKLLLLTLSEQESLLDILARIVIVDNSSRDGGAGFLRCLGHAVPGVSVVSRTHWLHHGPAMRAGVRALDQSDAADVQPANVLLFSDPDVIFRDSRTLVQLAEAFDDGAALAGEPRFGRSEGPDIQASFFAVRRDVYSRPEVAPLVHDGAPAHRQQVSIAEAGLPVAYFPSNHGGFILHRGRSAVAASGVHYLNHPYATVRHNTPHFMGVPDGPAVWQVVEDQHAELLKPERERSLVRHLESRLHFV